MNCFTFYYVQTLLAVFSQKYTISLIFQIYLYSLPYSFFVLHDEYVMIHSLHSLSTSVIVLYSG